MMYRALSRYRNDDPKQDWLAKVLLIDAEADEEIGVAVGGRHGSRHHCCGRASHLQRLALTANGAGADLDQHVHDRFRDHEARARRIDG
jgi:hypothetical protein